MLYFKYENILLFCSEGGRLANVAELGDRIFVADTLVISEVLQYWIGEFVFFLDFQTISGF